MKNEEPLIPHPPNPKDMGRNYLAELLHAVQQVQDVQLEHTKALRALAQGLTQLTLEHRHLLHLMEGQAGSATPPALPGADSGR